MFSTVFWFTLICSIYSSSWYTFFYFEEKFPGEEGAYGIKFWTPLKMFSTVFWFTRICSIRSSSWPEKRLILLFQYAEHPIFSWEQVHFFVFISPKTLIFIKVFIFWNHSRLVPDHKMVEFLLSNANIVPEVFKFLTLKVKIPKVCLGKQYFLIDYILHLLKNRLGVQLLTLFARRRFSRSRKISLLFNDERSKRETFQFFSYFVIQSPKFPIITMVMFNFLYFLMNDMDQNFPFI